MGRRRLKFKKKKTSKDLRKYTKKKLKQFYGGKKSRDFVYLVCKECKIEIKIRVNNKEIYTEEVKKDWTCLNCGSPYNTIFQKGLLTIKAQVSLRVQNLFEELGFKRKRFRKK